MKTKTIRKVLEYILVVCIILEFNTTYCIFPIIKRTIQILPIIILLLLILLNKRKAPKICGYIIIYMMGSIFPLFVLKNDLYLAYCFRFIITLPLLWIYLGQRKEIHTNAYILLPLRLSNVIVLFAFISIIMWLFCSIIEVIPQTSVFPYEWNPNVPFIPSYYNLYFETQQVNLFGLQLWRNSGIFNEAPVHNMILCTALAIEYFIRPQKSKLRLSILILAIISTLTTTGQLFIIAIGGWHIYKKIGKTYRPLLILVTPIILVILYLTSNMIIESKLESGGQGSVDLRSEDIEYCLEVGMQNPIMGVGIIPSENDMTWRGEQIGRSNSIFTVFARGGIYMLTLYLGALVIIPLLYLRKNKNSNWSMMMICYFGLFTITIAYLNLLTLLFIAWGLSNIDMKNVIKI